MTKLYNVDIYGLSTGVHKYTFEYDRDLFERNVGLIENGQGLVHVTLNKRDNILTLDFELTGTIELVCDRSGEEFDYPIDINETLIVKYGEVYDDSNDELLTIPNGYQTINVETYIYTYLTMAVPMKKLHPDFGDEDDEEGLELVYSSEAYEEDQQDDTNDTIDPRWEILKKLKDSNN